MTEEGPIMAKDRQRIDRRDQERLDEANRRNIPTDGGRGGDLDMGGGGPTGASGPGMPHRSNLDTRGGSPMTGALDDLPDMTGANAAGGGNTAGIGGTTTSGSTDAWVSTIGDRDINPPDGDNANMGQGSDRFDASDAYTGVESDDAVLESRPSGSAKGKKTSGRRTGDLTGSGDSGTAGEGLGDMPGPGIDAQDFKTRGANR
jgi:hypothetical protein